LSKFLSLFNLSRKEESALRSNSSSFATYLLISSIKSIFKLAFGLCQKISKKPISVASVFTLSKASFAFSVLKNPTKAILV
jgi:hypothetical protein